MIYGKYLKEISKNKDNFIDGQMRSANVSKDFRMQMDNNYKIYIENCLHLLTSQIYKVHSSN
jgi:hypothetical protein